MYYAYTALAVVQAFGQEGGELVSGFVAVQAVQVDFVLSYPTPAAQVTQHMLRHSLMQIMGLIPAFQSVLQLDAAMQAFMQCCPLVGEVLQRTGRRWATAMLNEIGRRQSLNASHRSAKSRLLRVGQSDRVFFCSAAPMRRQGVAA